MTQPKLLLVPRRSALLRGHDNLVEVLVRLQAPPAPEDRPQAPPMNLALVIDRSGSMNGEPLVQAVRCANFILDGLRTTDRAALVIYDHESEVVVPSRRVGSGEAFRRALAQIDSRGMTDLHGGWLAGASEVADALDVGVSRVLLLSDGQANAGITDEATIAEQCAQLAEAGVSTSTYGLGHSFNEELMAAIARSGGGNAYYGQRAEDLFDPFREEFDLLNALCARQLRLHIEVDEGMEVTCVNGYPVSDGAIVLPDLAFEGEAWALLRVRVPAASLQSGSLSVSAQFMTLDEQPRRVDATLALPVLSDSAYIALAEDPLVVRRVQELEAARLQEDARRAARIGDWDRVDGLLAEAHEQAAGNPWVRESIAVLQRYAAARQEAAFSKEAFYKSRRMRTRLSAVSELASEEHPGTSYLRRKREQGRGE